MEIFAKYFGVRAENSLTCTDPIALCCNKMTSAFEDNVMSVGINEGRPEILLRTSLAGELKFVGIEVCPWCGEGLDPKVEVTILEEDGLCVKQFDQ